MTDRAQELTDPSEIRTLLLATRTVAVLGVHEVPSKAAFYVPDYLHSVGMRVLPVNPRYVGRTMWGEPVRASLAEIDEPVDMVDVFRRPDRLFGHLDDLLAMAPPPGLVWLQSGIRNDRFADAVTSAGIRIVQSRCTLADHRRWS